MRRRTLLLKTKGTLAADKSLRLISEAEKRFLRFTQSFTRNVVLYAIVVFYAN